jgi:hypothetical protein
MSVNLNVANYFSVVSNGQQSIGKQGNATDDPKTEYAVSVTGNVTKKSGQLATATASLIYGSQDLLTPFTYLHFWADQDCYLQFIGSSTNVTVKVKALVPYVMSVDGILPAANTTEITGGATPSLQTIASIYLGNYSGTTLNYTISLVN